MKTEWRNYHSQKNRAFNGAYMYIEGKNNGYAICHAYRVSDGSYELFPYVDWLRHSGSYASLALAKLHAARAAAAHFGELTQELF